MQYPALKKMEVVSLCAVAEPTEDALTSARSLWPDIQVPVDQFRAHVLRCRTGRALSESDVDLHLSDLYLACGCLLRDRAALQAFEEFLSLVPVMVRRIDTTPAFADEVRGVVAEEILVGRLGKEPKLLRYSGEGSLRSWFTVVVQHTALAMKKPNRPAEEPRTLEDLAMMLSARFEPEAELLRAKFLPALQLAMRDAAKVLSSRERLLLRLSFSDGVTMQVIADSYRVNQSTVSRWIARALETWNTEVQRLLGERHGLPAGEVDSLVAAVRSRVEVSLSSLLSATISLPSK